MASNQEVLDIKIIGGGIAGLATALSLIAQPSQNNIQYKITVLESGSSLSEFGAGIQFGANATRILIDSLNLRKEFSSVANEPHTNHICRWEDDRVLGEVLHNPASEWTYGYPHWQLYRPDIQRILADAVNDTGKIEILFNQRVTSVDHSTGEITFADGRTASADLVVAADGLRGKIRNQIPGNEDVHAKAFKEFCYRATIPRERVMSDPLTRELMQEGTSMIWCGPGLCVLGYPIHAGELYNVLISTPRDEVDDDAVGKWSEPGDVNDGVELLKGFNQRCRKLWGLVSECTKWTLGYLPPLETFASQSGRLCVIGDAAHAVLPHSGQGGCMALEDAASLATCISYMPSIAQLPQTLSRWNDLRQLRMSYIRKYANSNQQFLSTPDGPAQERRDASLEAMTKAWKQELAELGPEGMKNKPKPKADPDKDEMRYQSPETRMYIFGYDAIGEARKVVEGIA